MLIFWILWGFDALVALIVLYFFIVGLGDGTVRASNRRLWAGILFGLVVILGGSWLLQSVGLFGIAYTLLSLLAFPAFGYFLIIFIRNIA